MSEMDCIPNVYMSKVWRKHTKIQNLMKLKSKQVDFEMALYYKQKKNTAFLHG